MAGQCRNTLITVSDKYLFIAAIHCSNCREHAPLSCAWISMSLLPTESPANIHARLY